MTRFVFLTAFLLLVQSDKKAGEIRLKASSETLKEAVVILQSE